MSRQMKTILITLILSLLAVAAPAEAARGARPLVDVQWLEANLGKPEVLVLDASPARAYAAQHIPGAINIDMITYGAPDTSLADIERVFQTYGISRGKKIVLVDPGASYLATRLFYTLYYYGFPVEDLAVLDGGVARWQAAGLPLTKDVPPPVAKGTFKPAKVREEVRVRLPEVLDASATPEKTALIEALGPDWHFGETAMFGRGGHIPRSIMLPTPDLFNADKTFKSAEELRKMATFLGIRPEQQVYTYCGGGVAASGPWFALKFLLGYPDVRLFVESELGWLKDERQLPFWTYGAPYLLRDAKWVGSWGGQMLRMYLLVDVSIVDVRSAAAYADGHLPFAVSVPAELFRGHAASPARLTEILGAAGVHPSHEAVVISGGGVTPESALAFAMLEKLGQKRVSVLTDPQDRWPQAGIKLTKDATVVGPKKGPRDLSIAPASWSGTQPRKISAEPAASGPYPRIFIASGKELPKQQSGTVVHVPYTDLLDAAGSPKAASEIWSILSKAGVPRYAELVCVSDDPGEAAVTYFVLRLMGFPDVKIHLS